jgi:hypothetical protein
MRHVCSRPIPAAIFPLVCLSFSHSAFMLYPIVICGMCTIEMSRMSRVCSLVSMIPSIKHNASLLTTCTIGNSGTTNSSNQSMTSQHSFNLVPRLNSPNAPANIQRSSFFSCRTTISSPPEDIHCITASSSRHSSRSIQRGSASPTWLDSVRPPE